MKSKTCKRIVMMLVSVAIITVIIGNMSLYSFIERDTDLSLIDFNSLEFDEDCAVAYDMLLKAERFADGPVGFAATIPDEIHAWGTLLLCKNAKDIFIRLEQEATMAGKLYALCGLYYLDYDNYHFYTEKYLNDSTETNIQYGCIIDAYSVQEFMKVDGAVRLKNINDTVRKFLKRHFQGEYGIDFYGGGMPNNILLHSGLGNYTVNSWCIELFGFEFEF